MSTQQGHLPLARRRDPRRRVARAAAGALTALEQLAGGLGTAVLAIVVLLGVLGAVALSLDVEHVLALVPLPPTIAAFARWHWP